MDEADVIVARAFADLATFTIVQLRASAEAQRLNEQLSAALTSRVVIEQAKGVICERAGIGLDEAFSRCGATPATTTSASPTWPRPPSTAPSIREHGHSCPRLTGRFQCGHPDLFGSVRCLGFVAARCSHPSGESQGHLPVWLPDGSIKAPGAPGICP
jgi:hypothetical protein